VLVDFKRKDFCFNDFDRKIILLKKKLFLFMYKRNDNNHGKLTHK